MEIPRKFVKDILCQLDCAGKGCADCYFGQKGINCAENREMCIGVLRGALDAEKQNTDVSQETAANDTALVAEPERASKYITIPVAEYHFLTKAATLLETVLAAPSYNTTEVVGAVRTVVEEMIQQHEAGAAE